MTVFDVIRYPVTMFFDVEDLTRIPAHIIAAWWDEDAKCGPLPDLKIINSALSICSDDFRKRLHEKLVARIQAYEPI